MAGAVTWPLVGRDDELAWLAAVREDASAGAVLAGSAGVGKTRLAAEFLDLAESEGASVFRMAATASVATVPFGVFAGVLPSALGTDRLTLFQGAAQGLRDRAGDRPQVVAIDDAHLLDDGSAALVHHLAVTGTAFVLVTIRTGEPTPDPIVALWKDGLAPRLDVQALSAHEAARLLSEVLGGQVDTVTVHRLWDQSQGNALFLRELVASGLEDGTLAEEGGVWARTGGAAPGPRLSELIDARVGTVSAEQQDALEILAVGEPLGTDLLAEMTSRAVLSELERRGLVVVELADRRRNLRLAHPLYAERLAGGLGVLRREEISRRLADVVEGAGALRADDAFRVAAWRLDGGGPIDPEVVVVAARRASALHDMQLAERLAQAAADAGGGHAAFVELGNALYWQGRHDDVLELVAESLAGPLGDRDRSQAAILEASTRFFGLGDAPGADAVLREAEALIVDPSWRQDAAGHRAGLLVYSGRIEEGLAVARAVLDDPEAGDRAVARAWAPALLAMALTTEPAAAERRAGEALGLAFRFVEEMSSLVGAVLVSQCVALELAGDLRALDQLTSTLVRVTENDTADETRGFRCLLVGRSQLAGGRIPEAIVQLREAAAMLRRQDPGRVLGWCLSALAQASALTGDTRGADAALAECDLERSPAVRAWEPDLLLARAWTRSAAGERTAAGELAVEAADLAASFGAAAAEMLALHDAVRLGARGAGDRLLAVTGAVDGELAPLLHAHVTALQADDGAALDTVAEGLEAAGALLLAAEAAAEAAAAHDRANRSAPALAARENARRLAERCGDVRTPLLAALADPGPLASLTSREREVAELAARGLSNPEIAERLFVSVRTVHNHLAHAFTKLDISRRTDLVPLFPDPEK